MLTGDTIIGIDESEEINHYGVLGMKWGVHRARKTLYSPSSSDVRKVYATRSLVNHKGKSQSKLNKLAKQETRLVKREQKNSQSGDVRAARLHAKAAKLRQKSTGILTSEETAWLLNRKANKLDRKSANLQKRSTRVKAKLAKNRKNQEIFKQGINEIDKALTEKGKKYLSMATSTIELQYLDGRTEKIDALHTYKPKK